MGNISFRYDIGCHHFYSCHKIKMTGYKEGDPFRVEIRVSLIGGTKKENSSFDFEPLEECGLTRGGSPPGGWLRSMEPCD